MKKQNIDTKIVRVEMQDTEVFDALLTLSPWVLDRLLNFKGATVSVVIAKQLVELALLGRNLSTN